MEYKGKEMSNFICEYCNTEITEGSDGKDSGALLLWMIHESGIPADQIIATFCNTVIVENADGMYTTECEHYPLKLSNLAKRSPILALADILAGEHSDTPIAKKVLEIIEGENK